ncbi:MAG: lipase maturation factor family protein [Kofleriaceae bacterium]
MTEGDDIPDVREPSPLDKLRAWLGPPRRYTLTRWLILRLLGLVYVFAFIGLVRQGPALWGSHGLTPTAPYLDALAQSGTGFWDLPSVLWWSASDRAMDAWAYVGLALSLALLAGYANSISLVLLWLIYGSFVRTGQLWFSFGWEIQILETTLLAAVLAHPWDPRPLAAPPPSPVAITLMRWLVFRIMFGAGLIKLRGDACWTELTCLDYHFETQPIPNPLSALFHHLPRPILVAGVGLNHIVEVVLPFFVFGPRKLRLVAGIGMALFQGILVLSGNLAFLNWLTLVPILACFDDDFLLRLVPKRPRAWLDARSRPPRPHSRVAKWVLGAICVVIAYKSLPVVENLVAPPRGRQAMNRSYDRLALVNTYGAFGSVGASRDELVIEGTRDPDPATAHWEAYELPCKPGDLERRPCVLGPYHRRLDWLIWFAAMYEKPHDPWIVHLVYKLLDGDRTIRTQLARDPFDGARPTHVRIRRFTYHLQPITADAWWTRDHEQLWLAPVAIDDPDLLEALARFGWPSPSVTP